MPCWGPLTPPRPSTRGRSLWRQGGRYWVTQRALADFPTAAYRVIYAPAPAKAAVHAHARHAGQMGLPTQEVIISGVAAYTKNPLTTDRLKLRPLAGGALETACPEPLLTAAAWGACIMHPHDEGMVVSSGLVPGTTVADIDQMEQ
jgi:hypothetical protein